MDIEKKCKELEIKNSNLINENRRLHKLYNEYQMGYQKVLEEKRKYWKLYRNKKRAEKIFNNSKPIFPAHMESILAQINGLHIQIYIDSGAEMSIITRDVIKILDLEDIVDIEVNGNVSSIGNQPVPIFGKVHIVDVKIMDKKFPFSLIVIDKKETRDMSLILGLDMLIKHKCSIDFEKNLLIIGGIEVNFITKKT